MRTMYVHPPLPDLDCAILLYLIRPVMYRRLDSFMQDLSEAFWKDTGIRSTWSYSFPHTTM